MLERALACKHGLTLKLQRPQSLVVIDSAKVKPPTDNETNDGNEDNAPGTKRNDTRMQTSISLWRPLIPPTPYVYISLLDQSPQCVQQSTDSRTNLFCLCRCRIKTMSFSEVAVLSKLGTGSFGIRSI